MVSLLQAMVILTAPKLEEYEMFEREGRHYSRWGNYDHLTRAELNQIEHKKLLSKIRQKQTRSKY